MAQHNDFGKRGEVAAAEFLRTTGHEILALNYRYSRAEVDIISKEDSIIVFTEVKARSTEHFGFPEEFVSKKKVKLMKEAAEEYMYQNKLTSEIRFDIISITPVNGALSIHHIKDAFFFEEEEGPTYN
jgi:putative endonuclease